MEMLPQFQNWLYLYFQVQGRNSIVPRPLPGRQRSQLPCVRGKEPQIRSTPLHMSTPRSILKPSVVPPRPVSAAKKVNFDNDTAEEGVFPLQESTIQDFTQFDLRKPAVSKVDVGTNTDTPLMTDVKDTENDAQLTTLFKQLERNILVGIEARMSELEKKMEGLTQSSCTCKAPSFRGEQFMATLKQQFVTNLDAIREDSESVTPSIQEESENITPNTQEAIDNVSDTPESSERQSPAKEVATESVDVVDNRHEPVVMENTDERAELKEPELLEAAQESTQEARNDENCSPAVSGSGRKRRSARRHVVSSPEDRLKVAQNKLRNIRKRTIPRHLQSFELSPKPKGRPRRNAVYE